MGSSAGPALQGIGTFLQFKGTMNAAEGEKAADEYKAAGLERAAQYGELKAEQTGAQLTQRLNTTLGNIDAIRAAAHTDPTSPTGAAYRDTQEDIGTTQKTTAVNSILAQSKQQEADAAYLRVAGRNALLAGKISAYAGLFGAAGKAAGNSTFGVGGSDGGGPTFSGDGSQSSMGGGAGGGVFA